MARRRWGRRAPAAAVGLLLAVLWTATAVPFGGELSRAPVLLVGPDAVTGALDDRIDALPGRPLEAGLTSDPARATAALRAGEVVAVLRLDLTGTQDRLLLAPDRSPARDQALVELVDRLEASYGRTASLDRPASDPPSAGLLALLAVLLGYAAGAALSVVLGAVAPSSGRGLRRLGLVLGLAVVTGAMAGAALGTSVVPGVVGATLAAGCVTLACLALGGRRGLLGAAWLLLVLPLPLVLAGDRWLLERPWSEVGRWSLVGSAAEAMAPDPATSALVRPTLVVAGSLALALVVLAAWRRALSTAAPLPPVRRDLLVLTATSVVATVALVSVGTALLGRPPPRAVADLASTTTCVPSGEVRSVADLNRISRLRGSPLMRGGDVGAGARLQDGRRLWLFGDTLRDADVAGDRYVRSSMLVAGDGCLRVVVPRSGGAVLPDRRDGVGYWPMSVVVDTRPGYDLVTVTSQRVRTVDADDPFGFEALGPALATYVVPVGRVPQLVSQRDVGADDPDTTRPMWGAATARDGRWLYLYGTARRQDAGLGTGFSLRVARVPVARVSDTARWRYWDGRRWSRDGADAATLIGEADGTSQTLSVFSRGGRWYALSKRDEFTGQDVVVWASPGPTGPFTAAPPVARLPDGTADGLLRYMPLAHPDLLARPGSVVVSYSQNRLDPAEVAADPRSYRPRFLRVPLP